MYTNLEALLVKAANNDKFDEGLNIVADFYKDDINKEQLKMQLSILSSNTSCEPTHELHTVIKYLQGLSPPQRLLLSEVCVLASLILVMPATNAVSEHSFSALRRIKSYLPPPSRTLPGGLRHLTLAAALFIPFLRHCGGVNDDG